ncbi:hypothetical protein D9757_012667 [Collybiopsis confluens]|uniref:Major facilitator superfamily (MFS) profile domain-containing protein n=1 Tax=Collybiopsis confluens TaxID=2823264 RepID=A0A8H5GJD7_9AGAR|nr:hypothetical protein D9757_012667 [Collybiopsis confluens]
MSIGAILQATAFTVAHIIVARLFTGFGTGITTATAPVWQGETSKPDLRGKLVVLSTTTLVAGFSLSNWMTYGFSFLKGDVSWRFPIAFQLVFSIILLITIPWLPESPRWLIAHERDREGAEVLAAFQGDGSTFDSPNIVAQKMEILEAVNIEREQSLSWLKILKGQTGNTGMVKRLLLGMGTQWMQQLVGINVTSYYLPLVLQTSVGLSNTTSRLLAACNSVSYLIFGFVGLYLIDIGGRRTLMMAGATGQAVCYIFISALLSQADGTSRGARFGAGATSFFFLYYVFFGVCWAGVPWLYPVEINSLSMRSKGAALATGSNWIANYIVVQITPTGIQNLGWKFYLIWMSFNIVFIPVVWVFYPETANRHLEDIDRLYRENPDMVVVLKHKEAYQMARPQQLIDAKLELSEKAEHSPELEKPETEHLKSPEKSATAHLG